MARQRGPMLRRRDGALGHHCVMTATHSLLRRSRRSWFSDEAGGAQRTRELD
jgi:hypothetical protein